MADQGIVFADMVGYSALAQRDEKLALSLLSEFESVVRDVLAENHGQKKNQSGDRVLFVLENPGIATHCAIEIQKRLTQRNAASLSGRRFRVRIGIHAGCFSDHGDTVVGDAVNIASRVEPFAKPGGICITEAVFRQLPEEMQMRAVRLGPTVFKNIQKPVQLYHLQLPWETRGSARLFAWGFRLKKRRTVALLLVSTVAVIGLLSLIAPLRAQALIQNLLVRAKGGDWFAYEQLRRVGSNSVFAATAEAAVLDVGFFFTYFVRPENALSHSANGRPITESVEDDVWHLFQPDPEARVVSAYQLRRHNKLSTLLPLREALKVETNLFAIAQMVTTISALTNKRLHCLDRDAAIAAASPARTSEATNHWYTCMTQRPRAVEVLFENLDEYIRCTTFVINEEPSALRSHCLRAWCYAKKNNRAAADADFAAVEKLSPNFPWLWFYRGLAAIGFNEERAGISSLNRAFDLRPDLGEYARGILAPHWHTNSALHWPRQ